MKKIAVYMLMLCLTVILAGCSDREKEQIKSGYKIYYVNSEENNVVVESYNPESRDTDDMIKAFLDKLEESGDSAEYKAAKPKDVRLLEYNLSEENLSLKFNSAYERMDHTTEILMRTAYVRTLVQIPGVNFVDIYVGERPLMDSKGNAVGFMNEETFVDNSGRLIHAYQEADLILYFANEEGRKLKQTMKSIVYDRNMPLEKVVIEQLIKGPSEGKGLYPTIPSNTRLLGVSVKDGICYVNFDEEFLKLENEVQEKVQIYSVVNSLAELPTVSKVQISINGITDRVFVDKINFNTVFERNLDLIESDREGEESE